MEISHKLIVMVARIKVLVWCLICNLMMVMLLPSEVRALPLANIGGSQLGARLFGNEKVKKFLSRAGDEDSLFGAKKRRRRINWNSVNWIAQGKLTRAVGSIVRI